MQSVKNITEDPTNSQLSYVSSDAICSSFEGQTLLTVQVCNCGRYWIDSKHFS